jgi:Ser/Thr protein kinase RdoA (MazF antagonist)
MSELMFNRTVASQLAAAHAIAKLLPRGTMDSVADGMPPVDFLADASIAVLPWLVPAREAQAWVVVWHAERGVLRARPVPANEAARARLLDDVGWLHSLLARLARQDFPAPRPLPAFAGQSWTVAHGRLWELVTFIPGHEVGWDSEPRLDEIGALLARYHAASRRVMVGCQRPGVIPLADVPAILLSPQLRVACPDPELAAVIRRHAERLAADLESISDPPVEKIAIHGDFTAHNVIADGVPPRPTGVIDFDRAHLEAPAADIAYGLWRSGRPCQDSSHLDLARLSLFMRGYSTAAVLPPQAAWALPVYLYGRGLQMIAKQVQAGLPGIGMVAQVQWTANHARAIADAAATALG